jgi:uncharacterized protein (DUF58 family)
VEFAEYRRYEIGDNPRYIDWNLFARSDKLYIRRYLQEENVSLFIIIDGSRSLTHPALRSKWDLASLLAAFTSYIALSAQDPVTISVMGGPHSSLFWGGKAFSSVKTFLQKAGDSLVQETPHPVDLVAESRRIATRVQFPGVCIVISDFLYPLSSVAEALGAFRARNMEVHAVQLLGPSDIEPDPGSSGSTLTDSETGEALSLALDSDSRERYRALLTQHTDAVRKHCLSHQIKFVCAEVHEPLAECGIETLTSMSLFV